MRELFITDAPAATVLVRVMTGSVFLSEGVQKFLYPEDLAAGRFTKMRGRSKSRWSTGS
jgi:putative oxidoreductase